MAYTSYFGNIKNLPKTCKLVSIAGKSPSWFDGQKIEGLAPKYWFFKKYKDSNKTKEDEEEYKKEYIKLLNNISLIKLAFDNLDNIESDIVLLCYEKPNEFCHRHILAEYMFEKHDRKIEEYNEDHLNQLIDKYKTEFLNDECSLNYIVEQTGIDILKVRKRVKEWNSEKDN